MSARHQAMSRIRPRFSARAAVLAAVMTAILIAAVFPLRTYLSQRSHVASLTKQAQILEQKNRHLEAEIKRYHDPDYLERLARECLGMVKQGEVSFVVVPKGGRGAKPPAC